MTTGNERWSIAPLNLKVSNKVSKYSLSVLKRQLLDGMTDNFQLTFEHRDRYPLGWVNKDAENTFWKASITFNAENPN